MRRGSRGWGGGGNGACDTSVKVWVGRGVIRENVQRKGPVGLSKSTDYVGMGCGEDVVDCVCRRDDAAATVGRGVAGLPGDDVACFFGMEGLKFFVSMYIGGQMVFFCAG